MRPDIELAQKLHRFGEGISNSPIGKAANKGFLAAHQDRKSVVQLSPSDLNQRGVSTLPQKAAYTVGRFAGDVSSDVTRGHIWRWNHPLAIAQLVGQKAGEKAGLGPAGSALTSFAGIQAMEVASGNLDPFNLAEGGRPKGFAVVNPKETEEVDPVTGEVKIVKDRTTPENIVTEAASRYFLGRTGRLLPWEEFTQERPDVSPEEYQRYAKYLRTPTFFGLEDASPVKSALAGAGLGALRSGIKNKAWQQPEVVESIVAPTGGTTPFGTPKVKKVDNPSLTQLAKARKGQIRKVGIGAAVGGILGAMAPTAVDFLTDNRVFTGTVDGIDGPEIRMMGYRVPVAGAVAFGGTVGGIYAGAKLANAARLKNRPVGPLDPKLELGIPAKATVVQPDITGNIPLAQQHRRGPYTDKQLTISPLENKVVQPDLFGGETIVSNQPAGRSSPKKRRGVPLTSDEVNLASENYDLYTSQGGRRSWGSFLDEAERLKEEHGGYFPYRGM